MAWTLGGNRIYVQEKEGNSSQIIPRLQPLSGPTVLQYFGYDNDVLNVNTIVVGDTIKDALVGYSKDGGTSHAFVSPEGSLGNWVVKSCSHKRTKSTCQTIDITQPEDAPVYEIDLELYKA